MIYGWIVLYGWMPPRRERVGLESGGSAAKVTASASPAMASSRAQPFLVDLRLQSEASAARRSEGSRAQFSRSSPDPSACW